MSKQQSTLVLSQSWTQIAAQYERHLVPRFMPWTRLTLKRFLAQKLPPGIILVPACGPGHELVMLAKSVPDGRQIIGIDLAEGMVDLANARCAEAGVSGRAKAVIGDACDLETRFPCAAGVISLFGLQQLPDAHLALANWVRALAPGGSLAVAFWPGQVEEKGPWQRLSDLTTNRPKQLSSQQLASKKVSWEELVPHTALQQGSTLIADELHTFAMHWANIQEFWEVMTEAGPWHARRIQMGEKHMSDLRQQLMSAYADTCAEAIVHHPHARLIVIRKPMAAL